MRILFLAACCAACSVAAGIPEYGYTVVHAYPHDSQAFTEGLFYRNGFLYESTGLAGHSSIRKVQLETGQVLQELKLPEPYFGEGIVAWKDRLIELTYTTQVGFVYDLATFTFQKTFRYPGEGWSMTSDGKRILMDDGTPEIRFWNPESLQESGRLKVTANGKPVENLNELEWVKGEIFANIWHTDRIARIDPSNGKVTGWIDLAGLWQPDDPEHVLNGIAYDAASNRLFVTGKCWPHVFEIRLHGKRPQQTVEKESDIAGQSWRSAVMGSNRAPRRAGM